MISEELYIPKNNNHIVQYGVWSDCCNNCDFCLRLNRSTTSNAKKIELIEQIRENIKHVDWINHFAYGISLLGGELFYVKNHDVQDHFLKLIDDICDNILIPEMPHARFSTVTNGLYDPTFLYRVIDRIVEKTDITRVDVNFSYDLKYRYKNEKMRKIAADNINNFKKRYNYAVGIQMILTQNVINLWKQGKFDVNQFLENNFPGCRLAFLYPHPVHTGRVLPDFNFNRSDFLKFVMYLKDANQDTYNNFIHSTKNSGTFKYTGLRDKIRDNDTQQPLLSDGKEDISEQCGHSTLYRCYADSDKCILCDLKMIDHEL